MQRKVIDNRYEIIKKLGAGATGIVYKVQDVKDKKIIALKILSKRKISSVTIQRFKREFKLLAGLHHPNLCTVYDFGTLKDGRSYFTMEFIDGKDIFKAAKGLSYEQIYPWIIQLCRSLEYIHSKGLIHYDIKPGNVLIHKSSGDSKKSNVKLMDFGLAGEHQIKGGAMIRGTFPYIAPEVIKGLTVDHRADLYSLGVLLYEIFTRRSFQEGKESFATLIKQRIDRVSEPPSEIVADIPKVLERLILRLSAVESAVRFSRANEVIKEVNKISRLKFECETAKTLEGYLLSSRFVGREKEMVVLKSYYEKARCGEGRVILITGEAGIGKSRLLKEFRIFMQLRRGYSFTGYTHREKTTSLEPFHDIFCELINYIKDNHDLFRSRKLKLSLAVLFKIFPDLSDGYLKRGLPSVVPLELQQERLRNFEAFSELLGYSALRLSGLVILLEDLHWADDVTIQCLEYLGRNLRGRNILICGTCRSEELEDNQTLNKMVINLEKEDYFNRLELKPLNFKNLYSFLNSTITSKSNSPSLVKYLLDKTGGNPYFVEEIMRTLVHKKGVSIGEKIEIEYLQKISIPETIEGVALRRLRDLDSNSRKVVKYGAVLLKDFSYELMKRLTGLADVDLSMALWELKKRQVLIEEGNSYRFYHATLRDVLNKRLRSREKKDLNYQVGKTLEGIYKKNTQRIVESLAFYFINAKDHKKGIKYGLGAAKKSSERYANDWAIRFYKGVLSLLSDKSPRLRFDILRKLANIEDFIGYNDDAIKIYSESISMKTAPIDKKINTYLRIGKIYERKGECNEAVYVYQRTKRFLKKMKSGKLKNLLETYVDVCLCLTYQSMGDYKSAEKFDFNAINILKKGLKKREPIGLLASMYNALGIIESHKGEYGKRDYGKAISYFKEAYRYTKKLKDEDRIAGVLTNLGITYYYIPDFQRAFDCLQKAVRILEKIGDQSGVVFNFYNLGCLLKEIGYYSKALDCFQKAISISKKTGNQHQMGISLGEYGWCFLRLCDYKRAKEYFEKALKIIDTLGLKGKKVHQILGLGEIYQAIGNYTLALKFYRTALKLSKDIGHQRNITGLQLRISSIFIEIGKFSKAKKYIEEVLKIANALGAKDIENECYLQLCRINVMTKDYISAIGYCKNGKKIAKRIGMKRELLRFLLLLSEIYYHEKKYLKGLKLANKAIKLASEMGIRDLHAEALLNSVKNGIKHGVLSKIEVIKILDEAKGIAEEIGCPEVIWKVYFEYGRFFQDDKQYHRALEYYQKCNIIFGDVISKVKNETYRESYLHRPDRQVIYVAKNEIKKLLD